jgi:BirA family biotin operon repressor/biotin-[acetyl-CoA-carboxylase] ligase
VALAEGIEVASGLPTVIKWPNDLLVGRRKLAGILAESVARDSTDPHGPAKAAVLDPHGPAKAGHYVPAASEISPSVVLGYGINVSAAAYPRELTDRATSLESELGRSVDRATLWAQTLVALSQRYRDLLDGRFDAILDAWRARAPASHGARVSWTTPTGPRSGVTAGIDERGALLVRHGDLIDRLVGGELTWA